MQAVLTLTAHPSKLAACPDGGRAATISRYEPAALLVSGPERVTVNPCAAVEALRVYSMSELERPDWKEWHPAFVHPVPAPVTLEMVTLSLPAMSVIPITSPTVRGGRQFTVVQLAGVVQVVPAQKFGVNSQTNCQPGLRERVPEPLHVDPIAGSPPWAVDSPTENSITIAKAIPFLNESPSS